MKQSQLFVLEQSQKEWLWIRAILESFDYEPSTGIVRHRRGKRAGEPVGSERSYGGDAVYLHLRFKTRNFAVHRLAWVLMYARWPDGDIDHIDRDGLNNRLDNLRDVPHVINSRNQRLNRRNTSGVAGVTWDSKSSKWRVTISQRYVGLAADLDEARRIRRDAEVAEGGYITSLSGDVVSVLPGEETRALSSAVNPVRFSIAGISFCG